MSSCIRPSHDKGTQNIGTQTLSRKRRYVEHMLMYCKCHSLITENDVKFIWSFVNLFTILRPVSKS